MNRPITALLLVFLVQCGIVATVYWPQQDMLQAPLQQPLVPQDTGIIDEIRIGDEYDNETTLTKVGGHWFISDLENLPANSDKVDTLLERITGPDNGWPIAQSVVARQRFQVADYHYQRSLGFLAQGEQLATVYLGTSPGFRKVHARRKGQDAIYSITFNVFDASGASGAWLDPRLLQIRSPLSITADSYSLNRDSGNWLSGAGLAPDMRELEALLAALRSLQVDGVATEDARRELSETEADLVLQVRSLAGETTMEFFTAAEEHFVSSSEYRFFFKLSIYDFDRLTGIDFRLISGE
ncbi:MAG: hypothetical protein DRQ65_02880 [Gammaproteobacteria bacterium]|nr:MAG: hypothetical protein DRQ65_02880 [Gammaproteobacteria bacterium]